MYGNFFRSRKAAISNRNDSKILDFEKLEPRHLLTVIIDNGDPGYSNVGSWNSVLVSGFQDDFDWSEPGDGDTATWVFSTTPGSTYRVSATWRDRPSAATDSPFTIYDGATQVAIVNVNQKVAPVEFPDAGATWDDLVSSVTVANNTLSVELSDLANGRVIADAIRVEEIPVEPDIEVLDGATVVPDNTGSVSFGSTSVGTNVSKVFTVENVGTQDLTLTPPITLPTGFNLVSSFGVTTLTPGSSTTFEVELDATTTGSFSGELSFDNNDPDEDPFNFNISGSVGVSAPTIIDNGDAGFSTIGPWNFSALGGYQEDIHWIDAGSGESASWTFSVNPGSTYRISATWFNHSTAAANSPFTILDGATQVGVANMNQKAAPYLYADQGVIWDDLMSSVTVSSSTLTVRLANLPASGRVIADAIRIQEIVPTTSGPEIEVLDSATTGLLATSIPDSIGNVSFGTTTLGHDVAKTFRVSNLGDQNLTLSTPITVPSGFNLVRSFGSTTLLPGEATTFVVEMDASGGGSYAGQVSFGNNDADEGPFDFSISGTVELPVADITDNADPEFTTAGSWNSNATFGYLGGINWTDPGDGDTATWTFDVLPGGVYQISATWFHHPTAATDSPFTIYDDGSPITTVNVNQQVAPSQFSEKGAMWDDLLSSVTVSGSTLTVELSDLADGRVVADAVRIQQIEPADTTYVNVAADVGLVLDHQLPALCWPPLTSGAAWADYNNDGLVDFMVTNQGGASHLYRNDGDTSGDGLPDFTDVAVTAGVDDPNSVSISAVFIDYDNDGDQDLYVTNWEGNKLYQNQLIESGSAVFTDVTAFAGLADAGRAITTAWGDFDQDGNLDVYIAKHLRCGGDPQSEDHLYRSNGDGTFSDVSSYLSTVQLNGLGFSPAWVDFDNDSDLDLYLVNDNIGGVFHPNVLWRNDGSDGLGGWIFTDISVSSGSNISLNGMGLAVGDYNNDGLFDFAFSNIGPNYLLENQGNETFNDVSATAGIQRQFLPGEDGDTSVTWGSAFFDHDNDSWLDLLFVAGNIADTSILQPNAFFSNNADGTFNDISATSGLDSPGRARHASMVDFDNDGFVDVFVGNFGQAPQLFHNQAADQGNSNEWLTITVEGTVSNRDGIGTRLTFDTPNGISQIREITSGPTHGGGDYRAAYFGLGDQTSGDLTVRWPNGVVENLGTITAGQQLHLIEPSPRGDFAMSLGGSEISQGLLDAAFAEFDNQFAFSANNLLPLGEQDVNHSTEYLLVNAGSHPTMAAVQAARKTAEDSLKFESVTASNEIRTISDSDANFANAKLNAEITEGDRLDS